MATRKPLKLDELNVVKGQPPQARKGRTKENINENDEMNDEENDQDYFGGNE